MAVDDLSLTVESGQIYGLVGSDGAGKTTTLRLLVGALKPDAGTATVCGYPLASQGEQARSQIGYLSQRFSLYEDLTVLENIRFFAEVRGLTQQEWLPRCMELLDFVGLAAFKDTPRRAAFRRHEAEARPGLRAGDHAEGACCWMNPPPAWTRSRARISGSC